MKRVLTLFLGALFFLFAIKAVYAAACLPSVSGTVGDDIIVCSPGPGAATNVVGQGGDDEIEISSGSAGSVWGDSSKPVGNDTIEIKAGATAKDAVGDQIGSGPLGDDDIIIAGTIAGGTQGVHGDGGPTTEIGGADTIVIQSGANVSKTTVGNVLVGDGHQGDGGNDKITIEQGATVTGAVGGDGVGTLANPTNGGDDTIIVNGTIDGFLGGDLVFGDGGIDDITVGATAIVNEVKGDAADHDGGNDTIVLAGRATILQGDDTFQDGGDDIILVTTTGRVEVRDASDENQGTLAGDASYRDGGIDDITVNGFVGRDVAGDGVNRNGADDMIELGAQAIVEGSVLGDSAVPGDPSKNNYPGGIGGNDVITLTAGSVVKKSVAGDASQDDGGNDTLIINGTVGISVLGDTVVGNGDGGDDTIEIGSSAVIGENVVGDNVDTGNGGVDTINIRGTVTKDVQGDNAGGNGGIDTINVFTGSSVGNVFGDVLTGAISVGGNDIINVMGGDPTNVMGDFIPNGGKGGNDTITVGAGVTVDSVMGDQVPMGDGGNDIIDISGIVTNAVQGDSAGGNGGDDTIKILAGASAKNVYGDVLTGSTSIGGNDTIDVMAGTSESVIGDFISNGGKGGNDDITIRAGVTVATLIGDQAPNGAGGNDNIYIYGNVTKAVQGDNVGGQAGGDTIIVYANASTTDIFGDVAPDALGAGGDDIIDIRGEVNGNIVGDQVGGPCGTDEIIVSGTVTGDIYDDQAATGCSDTVTIAVGGTVKGNIVIQNTQAGGTNSGSDTLDIYGTLDGEIFCNPTDTVNLHPGGVFTTNTTNGVVNGGCTVTIIVPPNNFPNVNMDNATASVPEDAGTVTLGVTLHKVPTQTVSIDYATSNGTANAGSDYVQSNGTITIPVGQQSASIVVAITDDTDYDPDETFDVTLSSPVGVNIGANSKTTVTITDNEDPPPGTKVYLPILTK